MKTALIAAIGKNNELGFQGGLPWKIKEDMAYFKSITKDATVIMGRSTWESLKRKALPNRFNIIVTRDKKLQTKRRSNNIGLDVPFFAESIEAAKLVARLYNDSKPIFFIGGAMLYEQVLPIVDKIYLTIVEKMTGSIEADVFFPEIDMSAYEEVSQETYFTAEYTVTNLVLAKKDTNGKHSRGTGNSVVRNGNRESTKTEQARKIHWEGASSLPSRAGYGY